MIAPAEPLPEYLRDAFAPGGWLAKASTGYEVRQGQVELAAAVDRALERRENLAVEGPCGTGKSIGYLVPAAYAATQERRTIVVTAGNTLAEQLRDHDLPALARAAPFPFTYGFIKGRKNYLCNLRHAELADELPGSLLGGEEARDARALVAWGKTTEIGDRSELPFVPKDDVWRLVTIDADDCVGRECEHYAQCHYRAARKAANKASIVVTNYHCLFADAWLRMRGMPGFLDPADALVCDEAHELAEAARGFFGCSVRDTTLEWFARFADRLPALHPAAGGPYRSEAALAALEIRRTAARFFDAADAFLKAGTGEAVAPRAGGAVTRLLGGGELNPGPLLAALAGVLRLAVKATEVYREIADARATKECKAPPETAEEIRQLLAKEQRKPFWRLVTAVRRGERLQDQLDEACGAPDEYTAYWVERGAHLSVEGRNIRVGALLKKFVFDRFASVVLTSATLTTGGTFDFLRRETGLAFDATLAVDSPFDFARRSMTIVPERFPPVTAIDWPEECAATVRKLVEVCDGRTLALFSSAAHRDACFDQVADGARAWLRQGSMPASELAARFRADHRSVLFGTRSFWTGLDVPGEALIAVVIDRLPFPNASDPMVQRMRETDPRSFWTYEVPRMLMLLRQGFGRLIRHRADYGVVVVLDRRVLEGAYAEQIWTSLPRAQRGRTAGDVAAFLDRFRAPAGGEVRP